VLQLNACAKCGLLTTALWSLVFNPSQLRVATAPASCSSGACVSRLAEHGVLGQMRGAQSQSWRLPDPGQEAQSQGASASHLLTHGAWLPTPTPCASPPRHSRCWGPFAHGQLEPCVGRLSVKALPLPPPRPAGKRSVRVAVRRRPHCQGAAIHTCSLRAPGPSVRETLLLFPHPGFGLPVQFRETLLHAAAGADDTVTVESLLDKGQEVDPRDAFNQTPLYGEQAVACGGGGASSYNCPSHSLCLHSSSLGLQTPRGSLGRSSSCDSAV
jgi:hypothetical protein